MALLAKCSDDVPLFFDFIDTFWRYVADDDTPEKRVDEMEIFRHDGGCAFNSLRIASVNNCSVHFLFRQHKNPRTLFEFTVVEPVSYTAPVVM